VLCVDFIFSHSGLDLPRADRRADKSVHEYLRTRLGEDFSGYEIDHIRDIERPSDNTVAEEGFH